jgi:hypothetical protein
MGAELGACSASCVLANAHGSAANPQRRSRDGEPIASICERVDFG